VFSALFYFFPVVKFLKSANLKSGWTTKKGSQITRVLAGRSNVFLVKSNDFNILVDTGPEFNRGKLFKSLEKLKADHIDYLVLTHAHFDHAANAAVVKEKFGAKVIIHRLEGDYLSKGKNQVIKGTNPFTRAIVKMASGMLEKKLNFEPCFPDILVDERLNLDEPGLDAYLLHTPGHTPGSISLIIDNEVAIVGDAMFGIFKGSVFPPYAADPFQMVASWGKLLETGCQWFLPAHGTANSRALVESEWRRRGQGDKVIR
jgi:glyoxylase-like metal-dependent hydrolase (beta-lactamase superfamily II)